MPLCKPALFSVGIFQFIWTWNDYFNPLIFINSVRKYNVMQGLRPVSYTHLDVYKRQDVSSYKINRHKPEERPFGACSAGRPFSNLGTSEQKYLHILPEKNYKYDMHVSYVCDKMTV